MKRKRKLAVNHYELKIIINALNELRTKQINKQSITEPLMNSY